MRVRRWQSDERRAESRGRSTLVRLQQSAGERGSDLGGAREPGLDVGLVLEVQPVVQLDGRVPVRVLRVWGGVSAAVSS